jgi:hypothetical protein
MNTARPILLALALAFLLTEAAWLHRSAKPIVPASQPAKIGLALQVQREGRALHLSWDRNSEAIRQSDHAILYIIDGIHHTQLDLNLAEAKAGRLVYWPETETVAFRLEAIGSAGTAAAAIQVPAVEPLPVAAPDDPEAETKPSPFSRPRPRHRFQRVSVPPAPDAPPTTRPAGSFFGRLIHKIPVVRRFQKSNQRPIGSSD